MEFTINANYKITPYKRAGDWWAIQETANNNAIYAYDKDLSALVWKLKNKLLRETAGTSLQNAEDALTDINILLASKIPAEILAKI